MEDSDSESGGVGRKSNMTAEEKSQARRQKMAKVEKEFYKLVDIPAAAKKIDLNEELIDIISKYWMLKRIAGGNKPLLPPRGDDETLSALRGEDTERDKMKKLVTIRQDLERVRNLAYMVSRREKLSRSFVKLREQILEKQLDLLADDEPQNQMSLTEMSAVFEANHGPTIYDKMFSNPESEQHSHQDFEGIISRIAGEISEGTAQIRKDNPLRKKSTDLPTNTRTVPYERIFSDTSQSESDDSFIQNVKPENSRRASIDKKKKKDPDKASAKSSKRPSSKPVTRSDSSMSSSEEEDALKKLSPVKDVSSSNRKSIYSESDSEKSETEKPPRGRGRPPKKQKLKEVKNSKKTESSSEVRGDSEDTQNSLDSRPKEVRTKAAMKEFTLEDMALAKKIMEDKNRQSSQSPLPVKSKSKKSKEPDPPAKTSSDDDSVMEIDPDDQDSELNAFLLVPQRGAARKAEQKMSKTTKTNPNETKEVKKKSKSAGLFGTSDDDSRHSMGLAKKSDEKKNIGSDSDDDASNILRKSPRRSSGHRKKQTSTDSESENEVPSKNLKEHSKKAEKKPISKSSDDEPEILSSNLKSKPKSKLPSPVKRDSSKHLSDSVDRAVPKQKKKLIESESSDSEKERSQKQKLKSKSKPETDSEDETETVKAKSNKSSKLNKSESPKKHQKSAANSHTKETREIETLLSESDDGRLDKKQSKKSDNKKKKSKDTSSEDELFQLQKQSSIAASKAKEQADFDDLFEREERLSGSDSESESGKKKLFDDFEHPEMLAFVPQRRAAKKASAQLSEHNLWRKTQQEAYLAELAQIQIAKEQNKRRRKKEREDSLTILSSDSDAGKQRGRSSNSDSSSSDSDSDRGKSPKGRGRSPKGGKAKGKVGKNKPKKTGPKKPRTKKSPRGKIIDGKITSSKALEYLMQRESQINNILHEFEKESLEETEKPIQDPSDTKLKTSEGRPEGFQSPPKSPKNSSDSDSDSDSDDSVIRGIKDRKKKDAERVLHKEDEVTPSKSVTEPVKPDEEISIPGKQSPAADKRSSRSDIKGDNGAKRSRQSGSEHGSTEPTSKESNRRSGGRPGDSNDISMETTTPPRRSSRPSRDGGSSSRERHNNQPSGRAASSQSEQHKQTTPKESPIRSSPAQKKSIFSPDRSPRTSADQGRSSKSTPNNLQREHDSSREKENEGPGTWRSPRERKRTETAVNASPKDKVSREIPTPAKSPAKSPALSRSYEGSRSSPMQTHRSPAFGRSPARHSQHPLNKSLDLNKSVDSLDSSKADLTEPKKILEQTPNKSDNEPEEERPSLDRDTTRKFSVESKDSDGDSAKSSLPDANINGLPDFSKEDSTDTLDFGDKLSDLRSSNKNKEQVPTLSKTDEGYVSAEKVQNDVIPPTLPNNDTNAQDNITKLRDPSGLQTFLSNVTSDKLARDSDKVNSLKGSNRLSTDDSVSSQELIFPKTSASSAWPELLAQAPPNIQQQLLGDQRSWQQHHSELTKQKHDITNSNELFAKSLENLSKASRQDEKKAADAFASQQQQAQYEAFLNQMFQIQRKASTGHELSQQQMAYAQKYMQVAYLEIFGKRHSINLFQFIFRSLDMEKV